MAAHSKPSDNTHSARINPGSLADFFGLQGFLLVGVEKDIKHRFLQEGLTHTGQISFSDAHGAIQINGAGKGAASPWALVALCKAAGPETACLRGFRPRP